MTTLRVLVPLLGLLAWPAVAGAAYMPSFEVQPRTLEATHIVVVTEGDKIDGVVEVLESWKGDLKKGATLTVPELARFALEHERIVRGSRASELPRPPVCVTGKRMVLFLVREPKAGRPGEVTWGPSVWRNYDKGGRACGIAASTAWVEGEKVYAGMQWNNPGPYVLTEWELTASELKKQVGELLEGQTALAATVAVADPVELAGRVSLFLKTGPACLRGAVIDSLAAAGPKALPALRAILSDANLSPHHPDALAALAALAKAGGAAAGPDLTGALTAEFKFWKEAAPNLKGGWLLNQPTPGSVDTRRLRDHHTLTVAALQALTAVRYPACRDTVVDMRAFWQSLPSHAEATQLVRECDGVLVELDRVALPPPPR